MATTAANRTAVLNPTLGPLVCDWVEAFLCHGPGDVQGQPVELDEEFRRFIYRAYEVRPRDHPLAGRRVYRRAFLSRPKGRAKSELAGMVACVELLGEVRFDGWDADGDPVARPVTSPEILCVATEEDQAGNTFDNCVYMLAHGLAADAYPLDVGLTRVFLDGGGSIEPITAAATSKDGGKSTFIVCDETHLWTDPRLKRLHDVLTRNITKRKVANGWLLETSTMYCPGDGSVAEETHQAAGNPGFLFDHRQAPVDVDIKNDDQLRAALVSLYGPAAEWTNIDGIIFDEFRNPTKRENDSRRYWLNQPVGLDDTWVSPQAWQACARDGVEIPAGADVIIGFDGSSSGDSTAVVAVTLSATPHVVMGAVWEKDAHDGPDWRVPRTEVMEVLRACCRQWRVREIACDPFIWVSDLEALLEEGLPVVAFPQTGSHMIAATQRMFELVAAGALTHDGDADLARHVGNAIPKTDARGTRLTKDRKGSARRIDLAVAAVMAVHRAGEIANTPKPPQPRVINLNAI